jgi:hypothetical protein
MRLSSVSCFAQIVLLLMVIGSARTLAAGQVKQFGDWSTGNADDGTYTIAITSNLDGDSLGEFCYLDKHCEWRFSMSNFRCEPGAQSIVLLNAKGGADAVSTQCVGELIPNTWTSKILQWSALEGVIQDNQEIAFAVPGIGTGFRVIRFSLRGASMATASIGAPINPNGPNARPQPARDTNLLSAGVSEILCVSRVI